jgi:hypothetical protein
MSISIDQPPINDPITKSDGTLTDVWRDWFTTNIGTIITYIGEFGVQLPPVDSATRDLIENPQDGLMIQNITTGEPQIWLGGPMGAWKNISHS